MNTMVIKRKLLLVGFLTVQTTFSIPFKDTCASDKGLQHLLRPDGSSR